MKRRSVTSAMGMAMVGAVVLLAGCGTTVPQTTTIGGGGVAQGIASGTDAGTDAAGTDNSVVSGDAAGATAGTAGGAATTATSGVAGAAANGGATVTSVPGPGGGTVTTTTGPGGTVKTTTTKNGVTTTRTTTRSPGASGSKTGAKAATTAKTSGPISAATLANGPGVSATKISIGYYFYADTGTGTIGANFDYGDQKGDIQAAAAYINKHGGIAGRMLDLHVYEPPTETSSFSQQAQEICEHFTTDDPVFAAGPISDDSGVLMPCLAKHGVLGYSGSYGGLGDADFANTPSYIDFLDYPSQQTMRELVKVLSTTDYFKTKWDIDTGKAGGLLPVKVGIIHSNLPRWQDAVKNVLIPALAAIGVKVDPADDFEFTENTDGSGAGNKISSIQAAVLQMRSDNVTNVIAPEADSLNFFALGSQNQQYHPRYAISSANTPQAVANSGLLDDSDFNGAEGFGWLPALDLTDYSGYPGPSQATCLSHLAEEGVHPAAGLATGVALSSCDALNILVAAAAKIPSTSGITQASMDSGFEALGSGFQPASIPTIGFSPSKHWGASQGWVLSWDAGCTCAKYVGSAFPLPS